MLSLLYKNGLRPVAWTLIVSLAVLVEIYSGFFQFISWRLGLEIDRIFQPVSIILTFFALVFALTRRPLLALFVLVYLLAVIVIASKVKLEYLGIPLSISDVKFFLADIQANIDLFKNYPALSWMLAAAGGGLLASMAIIYRLEPGRFSDVPPHRRRIGQLAVMALTSLILASTLVKADDGDLNGQYSLQKSRVDQAFGNMAGWFHRETDWQQLLFIFFSSQSVSVHLPPNTHQGRFTIDSVAAASENRPDILMILEESTFDPRLLSGCATFECANTLLDDVPKAHRSQGGSLLVHTTGGGTWLSEFSFLTGLDWRFFGAGGAYAPVSLAPRMDATLPKYFQRLGYRTIAVYPVKGNFLNAKKAYEYYGFDEFYSSDQVGEQANESDWVGIRDRLVFSRTLDFIQKNQDERPVFVFVLTIRNHGPHGHKPELVANDYQSLIRVKQLPLADYMSRMRDSATDYQELKEKWFGSSRRRVIGWFGDHQPLFAMQEWLQHPAPSSRYLPANISPGLYKFLTYYRLEANFNALTQKSRRLSNEAQALDISFLASELVSFSGLPLLAESRAAVDVQSRCHGLWFECSDKKLVQDYLSYRVHDLKAVH